MSTDISAIFLVSSGLKYENEPASVFKYTFQESLLGIVWSQYEPFLTDILPNKKSSLTVKSVE